MFQELFIHWNGHFGAGSTDEAGTVALLGQSMKGELAHYEERAFHLIDVKVHGIVLVAENAEFSEFLAKPIDILLRVGFLDAEQHQHAQADLRLHLAVDSNGSVRNPLCYNTHSLF